MNRSTPGFPVHHQLPEFTQSQWCHPAISSSVIPFSSCPQSLPASGSFPMSLFFPADGQTIGVSTLASVLPKNIQDKFPYNWLVCSPCSPKDSRVFSNTTVQKQQFFGAQFSSQSNSHIIHDTGKTIALTRRTFVGRVMSLLSNMLCRLVIAFLPRSKHLLISWLQSSSAEILEPKKRKSVTASTFPLSIWHEVMGLDATILVFWTLSFKPAFSLSSFTFIKRLFSFSSLSAIRVLSSAYHIRGVAQW